MKNFATILIHSLACLPLNLEMHIITPRDFCIELKTGVQFDANNLSWPDGIKEQLTPIQKQHLSQEFGLPM